MVGVARFEAVGYGKRDIWDKCGGKLWRRDSGTDRDTPLGMCPVPSRSLPLFRGTFAGHLSRLSRHVPVGVLRGWRQPHHRQDHAGRMLTLEQPPPAEPLCRSGRVGRVSHLPNVGLRAD